MEILFLIGRIIVGVYYIFNGYNHFANFNMMRGYTESKGVPVPTLAVILSGILLLISGVTLLFGYRPEIGIAALVIFFLGVTPVMHNFWSVEDPQMRMVEMVHFMKNMALLGSTLMFLAIPKPWPFSLGG
jgi:Predicted membrane protein